MVTVGSLFTGVGGFDLAFEKEGFDVQWQVDNDKFCQQVLRYQWPNIDLYGDVKNVEGGQSINSCESGEAVEQLPESTEPNHSGGGTSERTRLDGVDIITGGFPCQDLSVAGNREGLDGERSSLFYEFMRISDTISPKMVLIENVPGLLSSNDGRDFAQVLYRITGYPTTIPSGGWRDSGLCKGPRGYAYWRVLDTQYFGPPQRRRRVFIVGDFTGQCRPEVLFEPESVSRDTGQEREAGGNAPTLFGSGAGTARVASAGSESEFIVGDDGQAFDKTGALVERDRKGIGTTIDGKIAIQFDGYQDPVSTEEKSSALSAEGACVMAEGEKATTLDAHYYKGAGSRGNKERAYCATPTPRRLTPVECERLQGFPDNWTLRGVDDDGEETTISDTQRYKQMGNAVSVPVVQWIARRMREHGNL